MNCSRCARIFLSILSGSLALAAFVMLIYGSVHSTKIGLSSAQSDKVDTMLVNFINCQDRRNALAKRNDGTDDDFDKVFMYQCETSKAAYLIGPNVTALCLFFAAIAGLITVNHQSPKQSPLWFWIFGSTTMALAVGSIVVTSLYTYPVVTRFAFCNGFSAESAKRIEDELYAYCVTGDYSINGGGVNKTAMRWLGDIGVLYGGAGLAMVCITLLMLAHRCLAREQQIKSESNSTNGEASAPYQAHGQPFVYA